jgi:hypothetical protein
VPHRIDSLRLIYDGEYVQRSLHPAIAFELRPGLDTYYKLVPLRTNSQGLRDAEYAVQKPEGTFRVAVLGSSFTLPVGVELDSAFHTLLEERLNGEVSGVSYEFINFSCGAYNPSQVVATLEHKALDYDPDLILFATTRLGAPLLLEPATLAIPEFVPSPRTYPFFRSFLMTIVDQRTGRGPRPGSEWDKRTGVVEELLMAVSDWNSGHKEPLRAAEPGPPPSSGHPAGKRGEGGTIVLQRLAEIRATTGIPIVVVRLGLHDVRSAVDWRIEERSRALGIHYLDTRPAFEGRRASDFWIYELDPHPNEAAHEIFADRIADFLRSHRLLEHRESSAEQDLTHSHKARVRISQIRW